MTLALAAPDCSRAGPEALAGLELQHEVQLLLRDWGDWQGVALRLQAEGADLLGLSLTRQEGGFSARCRLKNISSEAARALAQALIGARLAEHASVEHIMLARRDAG